MSEKLNEKLEMACFQIISYAGTARSCYIRAIEYAEQENFEKARSLIAEGDEAYVISHQAHSSIIEMEETGQIRDANLLIVHSEDQMMSAETFKIISEKFLGLYIKNSEKEG